MSLKGIALCRLVKGQKRVPGSIRGIFCRLCKGELQVTPLCAEKIKAGELAALCNPCGTAMASEFLASGKEFETEATPSAMQHMASPEVNRAFVDLMNRVGPFHCAHCGVEVSAAEAPTHTCPRQA